MTVPSVKNIAIKEVDQISEEKDLGIAVKKIMLNIKISPIIISTLGTIHESYRQAH